MRICRKYNLKLNSKQYINWLYCMKQQQLRHHHAMVKLVTRK